MKKLLPSIMTVAFAIAITACGGRFDPPPTPEPTDTSATSTATATAKTAAESTEKPDIPAFVPDFEDISAEVPFVIDFASNISEEVLQGRESKWSLYSDTDEREKILFLSDREYTDFVLYTGDLEEDRFLLKQRKYSTWYWNPEIYLEYV
ncbi:MAG: hypothetical protein FWF82_07125, partial [Oscillospiraceae bacterium]|nr:hypothetical protein [Oscillospiraceae bacterium]